MAEVITEETAAEEQSGAAEQENAAAQRQSGAKKKKSGAGFCMYIGPSITGVIQNGTVYSGSRAAVLKSAAVKIALDKYPLAAELIVDGAELPEALQKVKTAGTELHKKYRAVGKR
ncbi:MAG: hypothetical protein LIO57_09010 [Oscillospiraceae bacterium]|nr:hypothetical protein [Oscillospiraceae bacterium]